MNRISFLIAYLFFMMPTYVLPWFGSNSMVAHVAAGASHSMAGAGVSAALSVFTVLHLLALLALVLVARARGCANGKSHLIAFPIVAAAFDMLPLLSMVPLVPTVLHVIVLVLGMQKADSEQD